MKEKKVGIYRIYDKNGKSYIGQSVDIEVRLYNHFHCGIAPIDKAWRKSPNDFKTEILEECTFEELNDKEKFWISKFDSWHSGYNCGPGGSGVQGENNPRALLLKEDVVEIRTMYAMRIPFREVLAHFGNKISKRGLQKVWQYETWLNIMPEVYTPENIQWHATKAKGFIQKSINNAERQVKKEEVDEMIRLHRLGKSYDEIAKEIGRSKTTVRKYCLAGEWKQATSVNGGKRVKNLETGKIFESLSQAADWVGIDRRLFRKHISDRHQDCYGKVPGTDQLAHWEML